MSLNCSNNKINEERIAFIVIFILIAGIHGLWTWFDTTHWSIYGRLTLVYYPPLIWLIISDHEKRYMFAIIFSLLYYLFIVCITIKYNFNITVF